MPLAGNLSLLPQRVWPNQAFQYRIERKLSVGATTRLEDGEHPLGDDEVIAFFSTSAMAGSVSRCLHMGKQSRCTLSSLRIHWILFRWLSSGRSNQARPISRFMWLSRRRRAHRRRAQLPTDLDHRRQTDALGAPDAIACRPATNGLMVGFQLMGRGSRIPSGIPTIRPCAGRQQLRLERQVHRSAVVSRSVEACALLRCARDASTQPS